MSDNSFVVTLPKCNFLIHFLKNFRIGNFLTSFLFRRNINFLTFLPTSRILKEFTDIFTYYPKFGLQIKLIPNEKCQKIELSQKDGKILILLIY